MTTIKASQDYRAFVKKEEGLRLTPYDDRGSQAIGYGSRRAEHVAAGVIDEDMANEFLERDIADVEKEIARSVKSDHPFTQGQMDTIVDMFFNIRRSSLNESVKLLNKGDFDGFYQNIGKLVKSRNPKTKQLETLQALVNRAKARQEMWLRQGEAPAPATEPTTLTPKKVKLAQADQIEPKDVEQSAPSEVQTEDGISLNQRDDELIDASIDEALGASDVEDPETFNLGSDDDIDEAINEASEESLVAEKVDAEVIADRDRLLSPLRDAKSVSESRGITPDSISEARRISKKHGASTEDALALTQDDNFKRMEEDQDLMDLAEANPVLATWGSSPENFPVLMKDPEGFKKLDNSKSPFLSDLKNIAKGSVYDMRRAYITIAMLNDFIPRDEAITLLENVDKDEDAAPTLNFKADIDKISQGFEDTEVSFEALRQSFKKSQEVSPDDWLGFARQRMITMLQAGMAIGDALDASFEMVKSPQAGILFSAHAAKSGALSYILGGLGGTLGGMVGIGVGGPVGAGGGAGVGFAVGKSAGEAAVAFQGRLIEEMRDRGFARNYRDFFNDPAEFKKAKQKSLKYATYLGALNFFITKYAGSNTINSLSRKKGTLKALGKDVAKTSAQEGAAEFGARVTPGISAEGEKIEGQDFPTAAKEALVETVAAPGQSLVTIGVNTVLNQASKAFGKPDDGGSNSKLKSQVINEITGHYQKAKETLLRRDAYEKMRETVAGLKAEGNIDQVKDFLKTKFRKSDNQNFERRAREMEDDYDLESEADLDPESEQLVDNEQELAEEYNAELNEANKKDTDIKISASEWIEFFAEKGKDPFIEIAKLGEEYETLLADADIDGTELAVPIEDFMTAFADDAEVSEIVRFAGEEISPREADANISEIESKLPTLFTTEDEGGPDFINPIDEPIDEDPVLRVVELLNRYRSTQERDVHTKLQKDIKRIIKPTTIDNDTAPIIAEMQFQHLRQRSISTGKPINDLASQLTFKSTGFLPSDFSGKRTTGQVNFKTPTDLTLSIAQGIDNPAVVLHELGHTWLFDLMIDWDHMHGMDKNSMTTEQLQYLESMQIATELLGYETLPELLQLAQTRTPKGDKAWLEAQETFAQTTEKYFLEGKFKNNRIRTLMEGLRRFLQPFARVIGTAYKDFGIFPKKITPEVERMFEGILGTSDKINDQLGPMFEEASFDPEIFGARADDYIEAHLEARDQAIGEFVAKITLREYRKREKLISSALKVFRAEAREEVKNLASVGLAEQLKKAERGEKIATEDFIAVFGEQMVSQIPRGILSGKKRKGISVAESMARTQMGSPDVFLGMLMEANRQEELIERIVERKIEENFPSVKSDEQIHKEAVDALQNKGKEKIMKMERDQLIRERKAVYENISKVIALPARTQRRMVKKNLEDEALTFALSKSAKGYMSDKILAESDRHGKRAAQLFKQGDIDGALDEKMNQIMKFEAYRQSIRIKKEIDRGRAIEKTIVKVNVVKRAQAYDFRGLGFAKEVAQAFSEGKSLPFVDITQLSPDPSAVYSQAWGQFVNSIINRINQELTNQIIRTNPKAETYLTYIQLLKLIKKSARNQRRVIIGQRNLDADVVKGNIIGDITYLRDKDGKLQDGSDGQPPKNRSQLDAVRTSSENTFFKLRRGDLLKIRDAFASMFSSNEEFARSDLFDLLNKVTVGEAELTLDEEAFFDDLYKEFTKEAGDNKSGYEKYIAPFTKRAKKAVGKDLTEKITLQEFDIVVTKEELLAMLLHSGSDSNLRHLLLGGIKGKVLAEYNPETDSLDTSKYWAMIDRLVADNVITKSDLKGLDVIWKFFENNYESVNDSFEYTRGYRFGKVVAKPIANKHGNFGGGYFPLFANEPFKDLDAETRSLITDFGQVGVNELFPHTDISYSNKRGGYKELKLSLDVIPYAVRRIMQMKHMAVPLYEFGKVIGDKEVSQALEDRMPGIVNDIVIPWVDRTLAQRYSENDRSTRAFSLIANRIRRGARIHWFFGSMSTPAKQLVGAVQALPQIDTTKFLEAIMQTSLSPQESREFIAKSSPRMKARMSAGQKRVLRHFNDMGMNKDVITNTDNMTTNGTFYLIQMLQNQVDVAVWLGAYNDMIAKFEKNQGDIAVGVDVEKAIAHADNMVELTQSGSTISNRAAIEQTSEVVKLFLTDFTTVPLAIRGQNVVAKNQTVDLSRQDAAKRRASVYLWSAMVPAILMAGAGAGYSFMISGEKDEEKLGKRFLTSMARDMIVPFAPVLGNTVVSITSNAMNRKAEDVQLSPGLSLGRNVAKGAIGVYDELTGVNASSSDVESIFYAATLMFGVPLSPIGSGVRIYEGNKSDVQKRRDNAIRRQQLRKRKNK